MDQCVKLGKLTREDNLGQFSAHLAHLGGKLSPHDRGLLLFQVLKSTVKRPQDYIAHLLASETEVNLICTNKNKHSGFFGKTPLMVACQKSNFQTVNCLLENNLIKTDMEDTNQENAIFYALKNEYEEDSYQIVNVLLNADKKLAKSTNKEGVSVLFAALLNKELRTIQLLLKNSADPNFQCKNTGNTPLHNSLLNPNISQEKKKDLILLLLNYNADPMIKNKEDKSAFDIAKEVGFQMEWLDQLIKQKEQQPEHIDVSAEQIKTFTKEDQNTIDENVSYSIVSNRSDKDEDSEQFNIESLTKDILIFSKTCEQQYLNSWKHIEALYELLTKIGNDLHLKIDIIGSYANGLWTPYSDIDIAFTNQEQGYINIEETLTKLFNQLKFQAKEYRIKEIYLNINNVGNSFPNIKAELQQNNRIYKIDITIFQKKNNGQKYVNYIKKQMADNPLIGPVFFVFNRLLRNFGLANPAKNGLKTYAIFLMILLSENAIKASSCGQLLINLIYYYCYCFTYEQSISQNDEIISRINLYDPLNSTNNVGGRKTDVNRLREMFKILYYGFNFCGGKNILEYMFSVHNMMQ